MIGEADFSPCGEYRYTLRRRWMLGSASALWVLLNPSTATAEKDDPTIRRCIRFSQKWGFQRMTLLNIFALRSTDPKRLLEVDDPVGPDNDKWLQYEAKGNHSIVVAAWGAHGSINNRGIDVLKMLESHVGVSCLGLTKKGHPRHPLYLAADTQPMFLKLI